MIKRIIGMTLALMLLLSVAVGALAETSLSDQKDRKIKIQLKKDKNGNYPVNEVIEGESQTTGLPWSGYYMPMLVQIDNGNGGTGVMAPWGARFADIIYETPLHKNGSTRLSFLFSDEIPESVGPVRSARLGHVWLREEWDAGFLFYGGSEATSVNINTEFKKLGATKKGVLFSGTDGINKPWKQYYTRVKGRAPAPSNVDANVLAIQALIPAEHIPPNRPYLFTDELPSTGDFATNIGVKWLHKNYVCSFTYDPSTNLYARYVKDEPYVDYDVDEQITFSNVIIQRTKVTYKGSDKPVTDNVGSGNADIFIGGRYIPGYWVCTAVGQRTIFFDKDGNELMLQRGKTYIAMAAPEIVVTYSE